jgi:hypothetical protein
MFCGAQHLYTFLGEIGVEPGQRQSRSIDGRLPNFSTKPHAWALELHLQLFGVPIVKALNGNNWNAFLLTA